MTEIREVHTIDEGSDSSGAMMAIIVVALIALVAIGLAVWEPWSAPSVTPTHTETNIIQQPADKPDTTIVNPPNTTIINPPANNSGTGDTSSGGTTTGG